MGFGEGVVRLGEEAVCERVDHLFVFRLRCECRDRTHRTGNVADLARVALGCFGVVRFDRAERAQVERAAEMVDDGLRLFSVPVEEVDGRQTELADGVDCSRRQVPPEPMMNAE